MERQIRYIVIKLTDVDKYLSDSEKDKLDAVCASISDGRAIDNKPDMEAVVVEEDWPMYEQTWKAIEDWVDAL